MKSTQTLLTKTEHMFAPHMICGAVSVNRMPNCTKLLENIFKYI